MITGDEITKIFCMADGFCKIYDKFIMANGLGPKRDGRKRAYHRVPTQSVSIRSIGTGRRFCAGCRVQLIDAYLYVFRLRLHFHVLHIQAVFSPGDVSEDVIICLACCHNVFCGRRVYCGHGQVQQG